MTIPQPKKKIPLEFHAWNDNKEESPDFVGMPQSMHDDVDFLTDDSNDPFGPIF